MLHLFFFSFLRHLSGGGWLTAGICLLSISPLWAQVNPSRGGLGDQAGQIENVNRNPFLNQSDTANLKKGGRILDDSTKQIYGAWSTAFIYERDWFEQRSRVHQLDTNLTGMQRYNILSRAAFLRQDLGNVATPAKDLFFAPPTQLGTRYGMNHLDHYQTDPQNQAYYDTKSPHVWWRYTQGGMGRAMLEAGYTQNVHSRLNIGVAYNSATGRQLIGPRAESGLNRQGRMVGFRGHVRYEDKQKRYRLLSTFSFYNHNLNESAGLYIADSLTLEQSLNRPIGSLTNYFRAARGSQNGLRARLYHQYAIGDSLGWQVFHALDYFTQDNNFNYRIANAGNGSFASDTSLLKTFFRPLGAGFYYDTLSSVHTLRYQQIENQAGLKKRYRNLWLAGYIRHRLYRFGYEYLTETNVPVRIPDEFFVGASGIWTISERSELSGSWEYRPGRDFRLNAHYTNKFFEATHEQAFFSPSLMQQGYSGNHFRWDNTFENTFFTRSTGALRIERARWSAKVHGGLTSISNYVYFGEQAIPVQTAQEVVLWQTGAQSEFRTGRFRHLSGLLWTENSNERVYRVPRWAVHHQSFYENWLFSKAILIQTGVDLHYLSAFRADAYMPVTQQFYLQNRFLAGDYVVADVFLNFRMKNVNFFVKVTNVGQGVWGAGYFVTPGYIGQPRQLEFGLVWHMFD